MSQTPHRNGDAGRDPRFEDRFEDWAKPRRFERYGSFEPERSGPFAGRGPKNYRRSDQRIQEDVCDRLTQDPQVDASEILVSVREGEITLEGTVAERQMKRIAEDCAGSVAGVSQVHNRLRIQGQPSKTSPSRQSSRSPE
jgi:hypothetical protein